MLKKILFAVVLLFIAIQFKGVEKTNPPLVDGEDLFEVQNTPAHIELNLKNACYDCHSNETNYPWYFSVAPVSWWTRGHIDHARGNLNFSMWNTYTSKKKELKIEECIEMLEKNWMPPVSYKLMHSDAKLSEEERNQLIAWFKSIQ